MEEKKWICNVDNCGKEAFLTEVLDGKRMWYCNHHAWIKPQRTLSVEEIQRRNAAWNNRKE